MVHDITWPEAKQIFTEQEVINAVAEQAMVINRELANESILALCILHGGLVYSGLLLPKLTMPVSLDTLRVTRYQNTTQGGDVLHWINRPELSLKDQTVLLMDDIFDEGKTLNYLHDWALEQGAGRVYSCVMVDKIHNRKPTTYRADSAALTVPDEYVFGMGMDYLGAWRNASGIWHLTQSA
jgi:hypoxanthine phosphoribosyltransferase